MIDGNASGDVFGVEPWAELTVDQQTIASEHDRRVDSFALPDGGDQITNARHACASAPSKVVAKLEMNIVEVKRRQSLEECHTPSYPSPLSLSNMTRSTDSFQANAPRAVSPSAVARRRLSRAATSPASRRRLPTITDSGVVYAINGAPSGAPTRASPVQRNAAGR